jgi:hypothetical protein
MNSKALPYIGLVHTILEKRNSKEILEKYFGPIQARIQGQFGIGILPKGTSKTAPLGFIIRAIKFAVLGLIRKQSSPSPFFDSNGAPKVEPYTLSKVERDNLRPLCGAKRTDI